VWHINNSPNVTTFKRGFYNLSAHRGSSSIGYGKPAVITDGDLSTYWLSYPGAEGLQWVYIDIQTASYSAVPVNRIVIEWGSPYASQYTIQYSNANWNYTGQWAYNDTAWTDTTQNNVAGTGGQADLSFTQVNAKYIRVLCQASSSASGQFAIKEIRLYGPSGQITNNVNTVAQTPSVASSMALGDNFQEYDTMDFEQYMSAVKSMTPPAEPMITINFFTGTTQEAADWVYYANVHKLYGIKYWEIGNENWGNWESGGPCDPVNYAKRFIALYDAMTAVDPSIVVAPQFNSVMDRHNVTMTAGNNPGAYDYYIDTFLKYLYDHGRAGILKGLSVHKYPSWMPVAEATPLAQVDVWDTEVPLVKTWINNRCSNPGEVKIWLTEYNDGIDSAFTNRFYNSLFVTAYTLNFLRNGGDYTCFFRPFGTPGPGQSDKTIFSDFGYLEGGGLSGALSDYRYQPRASFYAFEMMYNRFSAADVFGNTLVSAVSDSPALKVYANKRGDRKLSIVFVNTDQANTINAAVSIAGFSPLSQAEVVSYTRQNYSWVLNGANSYANPDTPPVISSISGVSQNFTFASWPYSVRMLTMYDSTQPTLVPSSTPTMLPT
ncbi:MAG TPA: discoidin domain-containing protein, partial [Candidatus Goldiibacteriota bacterium]|nr:discoidin domain-containing protein [Candidatus Goldiibacteriota bacterium]